MPAAPSTGAGKLTHLGSSGGVYTREGNSLDISLSADASNLLVLSVSGMHESDSFHTPTVVSSPTATWTVRVNKLEDHPVPRSRLTIWTAPAQSTATYNVTVNAVDSAGNPRTDAASIMSALLSRIGGGYDANHVVRTFGEGGTHINDVASLTVTAADTAQPGDLAYAVCGHLGPDVEDVQPVPGWTSVVRLDDANTYLTKLAVDVKEVTKAHIPSIVWLPAAQTTVTPGGNSSGNSVDQIANCMDLPNDGNPHSYQPSMDLWDSSAVVQGSVPHSSSLPGWWNPIPISIRDTVRDWPDIVPWFDVQHHDPLGTPANVGVIIRNIRCYVLNRVDSQWKFVASVASGMSADFYVDYTVNPDAGFNGPAPYTTLDGGNAYNYSAGYGSWLHGYGGRIDLKAPGILNGNVFNCAGVYVAVEGRLYSTNGSDISNAFVMLAAGADYYPSGVSAGDLKGYNPGAGCGRHGRLTTSWSTLSFHTMSEAALRANPPPINADGTSTTTAGTTTTVVPGSFDWGGRTAMIVVRRSAPPRWCRWWWCRWWWQSYERLRYCRLGWGEASRGRLTGRRA